MEKDADPRRAHLGNFLRTYFKNSRGRVHAHMFFGTLTSGITFFTWRVRGGYDHNCVASHRLFLCYFLLLAVFIMEKTSLSWRFQLYGVKGSLTLLEWEMLRRDGGTDGSLLVGGVFLVGFFVGIFDFRLGYRHLCVDYFIVLVLLGRSRNKLCDSDLRADSSSLFPFL